MSGKKHAKKGVESISKQIEIHQKKLREAREKEDDGLARYYEKELKNFEEVKKKFQKRIMPKLKRKKA